MSRTLARTAAALAAGLAVALTVSSLTPAAAASAADVTISGRVTTASGTPLKGMGVNIFPGDEYQQTESATTSATGDFSVTVPAGDYHVDFYDPRTKYVLAGFPGGYASDLTVPVTPETPLVVNQVLELGAVVTGKVVNPKGKPVKKASVLVTTKDGDWIGDADTDARGKYRVTGLAAGTYQVSFDKNGYPSQYWKNRSANGSGKPLTLAVGQKVTGIDAKLFTYGTVSGSVLVNGAKPLGTDDIIAQLTTLDGGEVFREKANGSFSFDYVDPGTYAIHLCSRYYEGEWLNCRYYDGTSKGTTDVASAKHIRVKSGKAVSTKRTKLTTAVTTANPVTATLTARHASKTVAKGARFSLKVAVKSYGKVRGATVSLTYRGRIVDTAKVNAAGTATLTAKTGRVKRGKHGLQVIYSGTATTDATAIDKTLRVR